MTDTIPDHVGREAVRLLNESITSHFWHWPDRKQHHCVITVAKLLMNPPAPMTDPDEEAAMRVLAAWFGTTGLPMSGEAIARVTEQMRKEREAWEAGR